MRFLILSLFIVNFVHSKELFEPYSIRKSASISKPFILKNGWLEKKYSYPFTNLAKVDQFLSIERIYCADITALNGKEIGRTGFLKNRMINTYNRQRLYFISVELIGDQNLLEITAACPSNQLRHGPTSTSFKFIPVTNVKHTLFKENLGLFAVIFISIAFAVVFFEFYRYFPDLKESLSNAVLSLSFAAFQFFTSGYVYLFSDNDFLLKKIEYFFLFSLPPLFMISLLQSYKLKKNKIGTLVFSVFILFIIAIISVSNFPDLNIVLRIWHLHLPFLFILMLVVHTIAINTKDNLANYTITGSIFLFSFGLIDILGIWGIHSFEPVFHYGGVLYLVTAGVIIGKKIRILANNLNRRMYFTLKNVNQQRKGLKKEAHFISKTMANISHDIKTPLSLIAIPLETLKLSSDTFNQRQIQLLDRVWKNYLKTSSKIDELLSFSKENETGISVFIQLTDLKPFIGSWLENYAVILKEYSIKLRARINCECLEIKVDIDKIEKILNNLINNTVLHGTNANCAYLSLIKKGDRFILRYWDNGSKTKSENLRQNIFAKFETTSIRGTGLGLYLSKVFAESMEITFKYNNRYKRNVFELSGKLD